MEHVISRDGVELHCQESGLESGFPVVLTHGGSMDHRMWDSQVEALSTGYRVFAHDVRGHGLSKCRPSEFFLRAAADDLIALLDAVGVERAVLVGHSLGATVSQIVVLEQPKRVVGFVGIGSACITMPPSPIIRLFSRFAPALTRRMGPEGMREDTVRRVGVSAQSQEYARKVVSTMDDDMFQAQAAAGFSDYASVSGYHIGVPLLLLQGDKDGYGFLLSGAPKWAKRDGGEFVTVPHAGHNAGQDNPRFVNDRLLGFLGQVEQIS